MTAFQLAPKWSKVAIDRFANLALFQTYLTHRQLNWSTIKFIESPFIWYPTFLIFAHVVRWSTTPCTARITSRRRPGRKLTLEYITSVDIFWIGSDILWWCWLTWEFFLFSTCLTTLSTWELVVDDTVDNKDNLEEKTREDPDIRIYHIT